MAATLDEFLNWLDSNPDAELLVSDDVYNQIGNHSEAYRENFAPTLAGRAILRRINHTPDLKPGTLIGMKRAEQDEPEGPVYDSFESLTIGGKHGL